MTQQPINPPRSFEKRAIDCWLQPLPLPQKWVKRGIDIVGAAVGLALTGWMILLTIWLARLDTGLPGLYRQQRIGRYGKHFSILKIRTMAADVTITTSVTTDDDSRITKLGRLFRKAKLDELPQLWNVLRGEMSFVGPRPDVPEIYDLQNEDVRIVLSVRPGITGPATIKYRDEERLLAMVKDPERHNAEVLFPDKLRINTEYVLNYSLINDFRYIWRTVFK